MRGWSRALHLLFGKAVTHEIMDLFNCQRATKHDASKHCIAWAQNHDIPRGMRDSDLRIDLGDIERNLAVM